MFLYVNNSKNSVWQIAVQKKYIRVNKKHLVISVLSFRLPSRKKIYDLLCPLGLWLPELEIHNSQLKRERGKGEKGGSKKRKREEKKSADKQKGKSGSIDLKISTSQFFFSSIHQLQPPSAPPLSPHGRQLPGLYPQRSTGKEEKAFFPQLWLKKISRKNFGANELIPVGRQVRCYIGQACVLNILS